MLRENKKCIIFIQILVKLYGEFTNELGCSFYFLEKERKHNKKLKSEKLHLISKMWHKWSYYL